MTDKGKKVIAVVALGLLALVVRLPGLGEFMTVDEENWMLRSGTFWHELFRLSDPSGTFLTTHPGATTMWLTGTGVFWQEARLGFDIDTSNLRYFRLAATLPLALATSVLIGLATWLLVRLLNWGVAAMAGLLLAVDPYLTGMSQVAHLDALLALFMLASMLAFFVGKRGQKLQYLVLAGVMAGLAMGTKFLPALWLWLFFALVLIFQQPRQQVFSRLLRALGFMFGVAALTLYVTWPALWVSDDFMRSFNRDVPAIITQEHVALELSQDPIEPESFYLRTMLGRSTPFVLLLTVGMLVSAARFWMRKREVPQAAWLFVYAIGFLVLMTLAAKKADRYAMPALVVLPVLAGWGFAIAWQIIRSRSFGNRIFSSLIPRPGPLVVLVILLLITQVLAWSPYAIAYNNPYLPNIRPLPQQGWGEGLDAAARLLNNHPLIDELIIASWYPGVTETYFNGKTMSLSSRDDERVGYVVTYRNMAGRAPDDIASNVLDEYQDKNPVHTIKIGGQEYVEIYEVMGLHYFPQHVGELAGDMEVGQEIMISENNWSAIEIGMANFSSRQNTKDVFLHVRDSVNATDDLRTVKINAAQIKDSTWHRFEFEPIADSAGKTFYVALTSPDSIKGDAVTVRFVSKNILPGQMLLRRQALKGGEMNSDFLRGGDMAYRLP
ncbi:MAG: glycosyltransferase family 39 protein [bacterium]